MYRRCSGKAPAVLAAFLLMFLAAAGFAADSTVQFRAGAFQAHGITAASATAGVQTFTFTSPQGVRGAQRLTHPSTRATVGGIIFFERAVPAPDLESKCPRLDYDLARPNGSRLAVSFPGNGPAFGSIHDWELLPTRDFAESGHDALFTYMGHHAEYHPAFKDNLAGLNLFLVDNTIGLGDFPEVHRIVASEIPGYPLLPATEQAWRSHAALVEDLGFSQIMLTDEGVEFVFSVERTDFVIRGEPYWITLDFEGEIASRLTDTARTRAANPVVYDSVYRIAQYSAFFRFMRAECAAQWAEFREEIARKRSSIDLVKVAAAEMPHRVRE